MLGSHQNTQVCYLLGKSVITIWGSCHWRQKMVPMAIQWQSIGSNGDGRNGANGSPHRHWHQLRSPLDPMVITIGDQWPHLNGSIGDVPW
jgi:hypothetical protein